MCLNISAFLDCVTFQLSSKMKELYGSRISLRNNQISPDSANVRTVDEKRLTGNANDV